MKKLRRSYGVIVALFAFASLSAAQTVPAPHTIRLQPYVTTGLSLPLFVTNARDGSGRVYIVQQRGIIKVVQPGTNAVSDFLNVASVVSQSGNERGLLGLAFHPQYPTNRRFFIYYTRSSDGAIEIAEYERNASNPSQANPNAVRVIITIPHASFSNHNGGTIAFGPDGLLYAGTGDGGSGNDPGNNAQNINALLGKFLRIDINTPVGQVPAYNIPPTNPYAGATPGADEIYAIGVRNPYRFSFDRGGTNQLWVGDVGQNAIEEVDIITLGGNYGWRVYEGTQCTGNDPTLCTPTNYIPPIFEYNRVSTPRCSVTGGHVYRGARNSVPFGSYVYGDYCSGEILKWQNNAQALLLDTSRLLSSIGDDEAGELYITGLTSGTVEKIVRAKASADFDGDLRTDFSVYRPSSGVWYVNHSSNGTNRIQGFGLEEDVPTPEDYDGDNITDIGVFRPSSGVWYHFRSSDNTVGAIQFGTAGDVPAAADYDGDAKTDFTVFRPSTGQWFTWFSMTPGTTSVVDFGVSGDVPTVGDYDGDGKADIAIFRPATGDWWWRLTAAPANLGTVHWGADGDIPATGDFDGDFKNDFAVFRPTNGVWYIYRSSNGSPAYTQFGTNGDIPVVGDYDGDGRDDIGVFRPSTGVWYTIRSSNGAFGIGQYGLTGDKPTPAYDAP